MSLFKAVVFANIMEIIPTNDDGALHLHFNDHTSQNTTTNKDVSSEGAFFVDVCTNICLNNHA